MSTLRGYFFTYSSSLTNSNLNLVMIAGITNLDMTSAKVFPMQILLPPKNGVKANGCLFLPPGVKKYSLIGSNLSGMNYSGVCQYLVL